jgi:hypothetical protein
MHLHLSIFRFTQVVTSSQSRSEIGVFTYLMGKICVACHDDLREGIARF